MIKLQIGKKGLTNEFIEQLKIVFKNEESVRISILKSACRDKEEAKQMTDKILSELGRNYTSRLIGYVVVIRKWRRPQR